MRPQWKVDFKQLTIGDTRRQQCIWCGHECRRYEGHYFQPGDTVAYCPACPHEEPMNDIAGDPV